MGWTDDTGEREIGGGQRGQTAGDYTTEWLLWNGLKRYALVLGSQAGDEKNEVRLLVWCLRDVDDDNDDDDDESVAGRSNRQRWHMGAHRDTN